MEPEDRYSERRAADENLAAMVGAIDSMHDAELSARLIEALRPLATRAIAQQAGLWQLKQAVTESHDVELMREAVNALKPLAVEAVQRMPLPNLPSSDPSLAVNQAPIGLARY